MTDPVPSKEWGSPEQVKFVIGFVKETKRQGYEMCPLHVDFLLAVLERAAPEPCPVVADGQHKVVNGECTHCRTAQPPPVAHSVWCNAPLIPGAKCTCRKMRDGQ